MTAYTRTHAGHTMTVHAFGAGRFDAAGFGRFTGPEKLLGLDVEGRAIVRNSAGHFGAEAGLRLVQFGTETEAWVLDPLIPEQRDAIVRTLSNTGLRFVTHTNYDVLAVWSAFGIPLGQRVMDTHLISKLINPDERAGHGLKELTGRYLDKGLQEAEDALKALVKTAAPRHVRGSNKIDRWGWNNIPSDAEAYRVYAGMDAIYVRRLLPELLRRCAAFSHLVRAEQWLAAQSTGITIRGLRLDTDYTRALLAESEAAFDAADASIRGRLGFSGNSPLFGGWLTSRGVTSRFLTPKGKLQVTTESLTELLQEVENGTQELAPEDIEMVRARLAMSKHKNVIANLRKFLDVVDANGRIHPIINTLRARTGRMSITAPALQTLKKHDPRLRHCLRADPGKVLIACDFAQVEVRVAAALSRDATLTEVVKSGVDIHDATAELMYGPGYTKEQRTVSKRCTFGTIYGGGVRALAQQTGVSTETAGAVIKKWRQTYPGVIDYGRKLGRVTTVVTGTGREIPADRLRPYANVNYAIQSTSRDLLVAAVYEIATRYKLHADLWLFVHDEVIVQVDESDAPRVRDILERVMTTTYRGVPITSEADILGTHWGALPAEPPTEAPRPAPRAVPDLVPILAPEPRRILITGSRAWTDTETIARALSEEWGDGTATLITGACPTGADAIAEQLWTERGGKIERHPADWRAHGRSAGHRRNAEMVRLGADKCLAFILNDSAGATGCARLAADEGIPVRRFTAHTDNHDAAAA